MKEILVLFKTHLDVGYTDLANNVVEKYLSEYIPAALRVAAETRDSESRFIWTIGSWLIRKYLREGEYKEKMREAIRLGDIRWHGLPLTTHTELMNGDLLQHGLHISKALDKQFGFETRAAKMTDVPGHTRAMIPYLVRNGVRFLHIGVNPASTAPDVPELFRWRAPTGEELVVMYHLDYGTMSEIGDSGVAVCFAHTGDNRGPQSAEQIQEIFEGIRREHPGVKVRGGTLEDVAEAALRVKNLPVVTEEIGDTWIHGAGTDPRKMSQYRALLRLAETLTGEQKERLFDELMMVPEHTWGLCTEQWMGHLLKLREGEGLEESSKALGLPLESPEEIHTELSKQHLAENPCLIGEHDYYVRADFERARISGKFQVMERSWQEQREYLLRAADTLPKQERYRAYEAMAEYKREEIPKEGFLPVEPYESLQIMGYAVQVDRNGSICFLEKDGAVLADREHRLGEFKYEVFSEREIDRFERQYVTNQKVWAIEEFKKIGMGAAVEEYSSVNPSLDFLGIRGNQLLVRMKITGKAYELYGAPSRQELLVTFEENGVSFDFAWFEKPASRVAEGLWLGFHPTQAVESVHKLGEWIDPKAVVSKGNRRMHAVESGVKFKTLLLESKDTALVNLGEPGLFQFSNTPADLEAGVWFNLFNNMWGTNFPMWYGENARFRFKILHDVKINA